MNVFLDLPDGLYAMKDHELYMLDLPPTRFKGAKQIKISFLTFSELYKPESLTEDIQHVGYSQEACGYEK